MTDLTRTAIATSGRRKRTAADYAQADAEREFYLRLDALKLAHSLDVCSAEVLARAEIYAAFLAGE